MRHFESLRWPTLTSALRKLTGARSIAKRMGLAFGLVLSLFAGTTAFAVLQMRAMERDTGSALLASTEIAGRAGLMRKSIDAIYMNALLLTVAEQLDDIKYYAEQIAQARGSYFRAKDELAAMTQGEEAELPGLRDAIHAVQSAEAVLSEVEQAVARRQAAARPSGASDVLEFDAAAISQMSNHVKSQFDAWVKAVDATVELTAAVSRERQLRATSTAGLARTVQIAASGAALLFGTVAAWLLARNVTRPIQHAVGVAERVAQGDLSEPIPPGAQDETGALLGSLARMQDSLHGLVSEVRDTAGSIETASAEVASGNGDLSQRTEQAAGHLQRTASSIEQLSGAVRLSAESAATADRLARGAALIAERGGAVVLEVVDSMQAIAQQSRKISDIIGVIDGIAFQTNILALNAAVEAARAGEQGKGFAVVASEVRSLAQRSAAAARDIKSLIGDSVRSVASGGELVQAAGQTMGEIVTSVSEVSAAIDQIARAADQQNSGIGVVVGLMAEFDVLTQQNATLVGQSAAAAESLKQQAERLSELVAAFRLSRQAQPLVADA